MHFPCCYAIPIPTCAEDEVGDGRLADAAPKERSAPWSHRSANADIKTRLRLLFPGVRWPYAADILRNGTLSVSRSASSRAQAARSAHDQQNSGLIPQRLLYGQLLELGSPICSIWGYTFTGVYETTSESRCVMPYRTPGISIYSIF
jgi:hypothetical protein